MFNQDDMWKYAFSPFSYQKEVSTTARVSSRILKGQQHFLDNYVWKIFTSILSKRKKKSVKKCHLQK